MALTPLPAPPLPRGTANLILTGPMGSGKTSAGAAVADELGMPFLDLDDLVIRRAGRSIAELFASDGEEGFRARERRVIEDAARLSGTVIATGGGAVLHGEGFAALAATGVVVVLRCASDVAARRLAASAPQRPLLAGRSESQLQGRIETILRERDAAYRAAGAQLDTTALEQSGVVCELVARYERDAQPQPALHIDGVLPSTIALGHRDDTADAVLIRETLPAARRAVLVTDAAVAARYAAPLAVTLRSAGIEATVVTIPSGEVAKTMATVTSLWDAFLAVRLARNDAVIAVGGGATTDVAGFAAATFSRGVNLVNVPTTLLGMVDAAIGGKVGIDHGGVKNAAGAFHPACLVLADPRRCQGLGAATLRQGIAEAVKVLLLASPAALEMVETAPGTAAGHLGWLIEQAVRIKAAYVAADPRDGSLRNSLNLGHTFAHGIESATGYAVSHGDAVAIGLVLAARLGAAEGTVPPGLAARITTLLGALGLPAEIPRDAAADVIIAAMRSDKKRRDGGVAFVVPAAGGCALLSGADPATVLSMTAAAVPA